MQPAHCLPRIPQRHGRHRQYAHGSKRCNAGANPQVSNSLRIHSWHAPSACCIVCSVAAPRHSMPCRVLAPLRSLGWPTRQPSRDGPGCKSARPAPSSAVRTTNTLQLIASGWRVSGCSARSLARVLGHPSTPGHTVDHSFRTPITSKLYKAHTAVTPSVL